MKLVNLDADQAFTQQTTNDRGHAKQNRPNSGDIIIDHMVCLHLVLNTLSHHP